jgi:hypothetical protein
MEKKKIFKVSLVFEDGSNCHVVTSGIDASEAIAATLKMPSVRKYMASHNIVDFNAEELDELPIPPKDRFWLESAGDGKYVVIDEQRKRALSFEFGRLRYTRSSVESRCCSEIFSTPVARKQL